MVRTGLVALRSGLRDASGSLVLADFEMKTFTENIAEYERQRREADLFVEKVLSHQKKDFRYALEIAMIEQQNQTTELTYEPDENSF